jgi:hypothetical protein
MICREKKCCHNLNLGGTYSWLASMEPKGDVTKTSIELVDGFVMVESDPRPQPQLSVQQILPSFRVAPKSLRSTVKQLQLEKRARALRFATSLQGPPPLPPLHTRHNVQRSKVNQVIGSDPTVYHTNIIKKAGNCMSRAFGIGLGDSLETSDAVSHTAIRWWVFILNTLSPLLLLGSKVSD